MRLVVLITGYVMMVIELVTSDFVGPFLLFFPLTGCSCRGSKGRQQEARNGAHGRGQRPSRIHTPNRVG